MAAVSFAKDIAPLFTKIDVEHMCNVTQCALRLNDYDSVKSSATDIYNAVSGGFMPPAPEGPWSQDKVALFNQWIQDGMQP